jgi:hypothetical protein
LDKFRRFVACDARRKRHVANLPAFFQLDLSPIKRIAE